MSTTTARSAPTRPRVAVWKFASCDGCQLSLLGVESQLLTLAEQVEIAYFLEVTSRVGEGPYDLSLVEGSITTPDDAARIRHVRDVSGTLVTIGACATAGGIQALRNTADVEDYRAVTYARPTFVESLATSTPVAAHVGVDLELRGCPVEPTQLLEVISATLAGRPPVLPTHSVCLDCKLRGLVCVAVADGQPCLGPVTATGCGARCPAVGRGCYGCFGPTPDAPVDTLAADLRDRGATAGQLVRLLRTFNAAAPAFAAAADRQQEAADRQQAGEDQP